MQRNEVNCSKCGQVNNAAMHVCFKCGNILPAGASNNNAGAIGPGRKFGGTVVSGNKAVDSGRRLIGTAEPITFAAPAVDVNPHPRRHAAQQESTINLKPSFFERYDDGGTTVFACIAGIVTAILALLTSGGKWVLFERDLMVIGISDPQSLQEVSKLTKGLAGFAQYFDKDTASTLQIISFVSTAAYWILLIGAIIAITQSLLILILPKFEIMVFIPFICVCAFAVIGLLFTAAPIIYSEILGFLPIPIIMTIVAGVPAAIMKFIL